MREHADAIFAAWEKLPANIRASIAPADLRPAVAAFLRAWMPSDEACEGAGRAPHKLQYACRATADELEQP